MRSEQLGTATSASAGYAASRLRGAAGRSPSSRCFICRAFTSPLPRKWLFYAVKSGDNLGKIAKTHGITLKALRAAHNLKTDRITVGHKLKIPAKAAATPETAPAPPPGIDPATGLPVPAR